MKRTEILEQLKTFVYNLSKEPEAETKPEEVEVKAEEVQPEVVEEKQDEAVEVKSDYATLDDLAKVVEEVKSLFSKQYETFETKTKELESKNVELSKQLDEKPDAPKVVHSPEVKEVNLKTVESRFLNAIRKNK